MKYAMTNTSLNILRGEVMRLQRRRTALKVTFRMLQQLQSRIESCMGYLQVAHKCVQLNTLLQATCANLNEQVSFAASHSLLFKEYHERSNMLLQEAKAIFSKNFPDMDETVLRQIAIYRGEGKNNTVCSDVELQAAKKANNLELRIRFQAREYDVQVVRVSTSLNARQFTLSKALQQAIASELTKQHLQHLANSREASAANVMQRMLASREHAIAQKKHAEAAIYDELIAHLQSQ